ncbi:MAG: hypothetical protein RRY78_04900 [Clostridia bacterium]
MRLKGILLITLLMLSLLLVGCLKVDEAQEIDRIEFEKFDINNIYYLQKIEQEKLLINVHYKNGNSKTVGFKTALCLQGFKTDELGEQTLILKIDGKILKIKYEVKQKEIAKIEFVCNAGVKYLKDEKLTGKLILNVFYKDKTKQEVNASEFVNFDSSKLGDYTKSFEYGGSKFNYNYSVVDVTTLYAPTNLHYSNNTLGWDSVDFAEYYLLNIDGKEIKVTQNFYKIVEDFKRVKVQAKADSKFFKNSLAVDFKKEYTVTFPSVIGVNISAKTQKVEVGNSLSFNASASVGYDSNFIVSANGQSLTPENNVYTIKNIESNIDIKVSAPTLSVYNVRVIHNDFCAITTSKTQGNYNDSVTLNFAVTEGIDYTGATIKINDKVVPFKERISLSLTQNVVVEAQNIKPLTFEVVINKNGVLFESKSIVYNQTFNMDFTLENVKMIIVDGIVLEGKKVVITNIKEAHNIEIFY